MASGLTSAQLKTLLVEAEQAEREERDAADRERLDRIEQRLEELGDVSRADVEWMRGLKEQLERDEDEPETPKAEAPKLEPKPKPKPKPETEDEDEGPAMRPGRKNGQLYSFDVDEDGSVRRLDIPKLYTGEDEDDEVPLPDAEAV